MNAPIWHAVQELAAVWRSSAYVRDYVAGLGAIGGTRSSAWHVEAQPFYLSLYLPTTSEYDVFARSAGAPAWLERSELLGHAYTTMIEWLRSRLGGYPYPGAPQLTRTSPWTNFNVSMKVPWLIDFRRQQLQHKTTPPTIPFLAVDPAMQLEAGARLGQAIESSPAATHVDAAWRSLTDTDRQQLRDVSTALQQARYPQPDDITGSEDSRELAWSETELDAALRSLTGRARAFTDALTHADQLLQQTAALFSHLTIYETIRQIGNIALIQQLDGTSGWHTIRSNADMLPIVRHFEILGFDHPYPRGVMLVEGAKEEFSRHHIAVTVHGRILPDSRDLAATAIPTHLGKTHDAQA